MYDLQNSWIFITCASNKRLMKSYVLKLE